MRFGKTIPLIALIGLALTAGCASEYTPDPDDPVYLARVEAYWASLRASHARADRVYTDVEWAEFRRDAEQRTAEDRERVFSGPSLVNRLFSMSVHDTRKHRISKYLSG